MTETNTPEASEYTDRDLPRLYVAGPMTGLPDYNYPAFDGAAALLAMAHDPEAPPKCACGDTSRTGVVHREDGPCYVEPESEGE